MERAGAKKVEWEGGGEERKKVAIESLCCRSFCPQDRLFVISPPLSRCLHIDEERGQEREGEKEKKSDRDMYLLRPWLGSSTDVTVRSVGSRKK